MTWPRICLAGMLACVAVIAWAVHDLSRTWADSLRLPDPDEQEAPPTWLR